MVIPRPRAGGLGLALASAGLFWEVASGYWDVYSHRLLFRAFDPWWNPAHLSLYAGVAIVAAGIAGGRRRAPAALGPAYALALLGLLLQAAAGLFNEAWHRLGGPSLALEPPHILLVLGMVVAGYGIATGLATLVAAGRGSRGRAAPVVDGALLLAFASLWLVAVGSLLFIGFAEPLRAGPLHLPFAALLAAVAALVAVPALPSAPWPGFATLLGGLLAATNGLLLIAYLGLPPYPPWGLLPFALLDALQLLLARRLAPPLLASLEGLALGGLIYAAAFPFSVELLDPMGPTAAVGAAAGLPAGLLAHWAIRGTGAWVRRRAAVAP